MERFDLARALVLEAGEALRNSSLREDEVGCKTGYQDLVTRWDRETEQFLRRGILAAFPGDAIVGEEYPADNPGTEGCTWYLDPIDGTTNFVSQHRNYAVSVGCWRGEEPLFGLVLDVERPALFWAKAGEGAWRDETPLGTSRRRAVPQLLLAAPGVPATFFQENPWRTGALRLAREARGVRSLGSVALELCALAAGEADLFWPFAPAPGTTTPPGSSSGRRAGRCAPWRGSPSP